MINFMNFFFFCLVFMRGVAIFVNTSGFESLKSACAIFTLLKIQKLFITFHLVSMVSSERNIFQNMYAVTKL